MYYYTDYNTFKLILTNGTLRFKESTASNDRLDIIQLYKPIKDYIAEDNADKALETIQEIYS